MQKYPSTYFHFFKVKHEYEYNYLCNLPYEQRNDVIDAEMGSAYERYRYQHCLQYGFEYDAVEGIVDCQRVPDEDDNVTFINWCGTETGALPRWLNEYFGIDLFEDKSTIMKLKFKDVINLCYACNQTDCPPHYYSNISDVSLCKEFFPAQYPSEDDGEEYGTDYQIEVNGTINFMQEVLSKIDFRKETLYVLVSNYE